MKLLGKFLVLILPLIVGGLVVLSFVLIDHASKALTHSFSEKLNVAVVRTEKALELCFSSADNFLITLSRDPYVIETIQKFHEAFHWIEHNLGDPTEILQKAYIDDNPYPVGEKHKLFFVEREIRRGVEEIRSHS